MSQNQGQDDAQPRPPVEIDPGEMVEIKEDQPTQPTNGQEDQPINDGSGE